MIHAGLDLPLALADPESWGLLTKRMQRLGCSIAGRTGGTCSHGNANMLDEMKSVEGHRQHYTTATTTAYCHSAYRNHRHHRLCSTRHQRMGTAAVQNRCVFNFIIILCSTYLCLAPCNVLTLLVNPYYLLACTKCDKLFEYALPVRLALYVLVTFLDRALDG